VRSFIFAVEFSVQVAKTYLIDVIEITFKLNAILALTRLIFPPEYKLNWIQFIKITLIFKIYYEFLSSFMMPATESCI